MQHLDAPLIVSRSMTTQVEDLHIWGASEWSPEVKIEM